MRNLSRLAALFCLWLPLAMGQTEPKSLIYSGYYNVQSGKFDSLTVVNPVVGCDMFFGAGFFGASTVIGNVEGGNIWFGHEAFIRPAGGAADLVTYINPEAANELDLHATTVGHVLAGSGYDGIGSYSYLGLGMAPQATLVSGAIATGFSPTQFGSFSTSEASVVTAYQAFFEGVGLGADKPDVINSSWGGGDPSGSSPEILAIDGLARQNASVAFVVSAGNDGNVGDGTTPVSAPASGFNNISVGSLGGTSFLQPSGFSSKGLTDFYNPASGVTLTGVRAAVDIAAPGENLYLAVYLGDSGSVAARFPADVIEPSPANYYAYNSNGTSYSAPIVAGGIALLKDVAKTDQLYNHIGNEDALDTRVIKSVLMAGARKTVGWNNGQNALNVTTQALDLQTGAGALDLVAAADVYLFGTRELALDGGGAIETIGWDAATIDLGHTFEYVFSSAFSQQMALTVALNWFTQRGFDDLAQTGSDLAFSNLDLQVWSVDGSGQFLAKVGESSSTYNNTEFLRFDALGVGRYGLRVVFDSMVFDTTNAVTSEYYGLAWQAVAIPEAGTTACLAAAGLLCLRRRRSAGMAGP